MVFELNSEGSNEARRMGNGTREGVGWKEHDISWDKGNEAKAPTAEGKVAWDEVGIGAVGYVNDSILAPRNSRELAQGAIEDLPLKWSFWLLLHEKQDTKNRLFATWWYFQLYWLGFLQCLVWLSHLWHRACRITIEGSPLPFLPKLFQFAVPFLLCLVSPLSPHVSPCSFFWSEPV